eukprot:7960545-Alexandrium_andersonii.AAC.1
MATQGSKLCVPLELVSFGICRWMAEDVADPRPYRDGYQSPADQGAPGWALVVQTEDWVNHSIVRQSVGSPTLFRP